MITPNINPERQLKDLVIFGDRLREKQPDGIHFYLGSSIPLIEGRLILFDGFMIVRNDFKLFPKLICDLGFKVQNDYFFSSDFYSIPLITIPVMHDDEGFERILGKCINELHSRLRRGSVFSNPRFQRYLIDTNSNERGVFETYLHRVNSEKTNEEDFVYIENPLIVAKFYNYNKFLRNRKKTEDYFQRESQFNKSKN